MKYDSIWIWKYEVQIQNVQKTLLRFHKLESIRTANFSPEKSQFGGQIKNRSNEIAHFRNHRMMCKQGIWSTKQNVEILRIRKEKKII